MTGRSGRRRGFALLITITLVAFLVLIVVSLATMTRVETRVATNAQTTDQARQNALLGLQIALGRLQETAGPDQRSTATADILAGTAAGKTHWTGVWKRDTADTALDPTDDIAPVWLGWMVSGPEGKTPAGNQTPSPGHVAIPAITDTAVTLVGPQTVSLAGDQIAVTLETIKADDLPGLAAGPVDIGRFGYWVGDEGVKSRVNLEDYWGSPAVSASATPTADQQARLAFAAPQKNNFTQLLGQSLPDAGKLKEVLNLGQLPYLYPGSMPNPLSSSAKDHFHRITPYARGLLADTRAGGLRQDLTRILIDGSGPSDDTSLYPAYLETSLYAGTLPTQIGLRPPTIGLLRSWARYNAPIGTAGSVAARQGDINTAAVGPVVLHYGIGFGASHDGANLQVQIFPSIVLWNPYPVTLEAPAAGYEMGIRMGNNTGNWGNTYELQFASKSDLSDRVYFRIANGTYGTSPGGPSNARTYRFTLDPVAIPPGEAVIYSIDQAGTAYADGMLMSVGATDPLTAGAVIGGSYPFTPALDVDGVTPLPVKIGGSGSAENGLYLVDAATVNATTVIDDTTPCFMKNQSLTASTWTALSPTNFATSQALTPAPARRFTHGGVMPMGRLQAAQNIGANTNYDIRWLMTFNPRGVLYHSRAFPTSGGTGTSKSYPMAHREKVSVSFGSHLPTYADAFGHIQSVGNDLGGSSNSLGGKLAVYDLPRTGVPLVSVADLRHVDIIRHAAGPNHAIGGSLATISLLRDQDHTPGDARYIDWSHVANRELWDRYFFSTLPSSLAANYRTDPDTSHPFNARLAYLEDPVPSDLTDYQKAAANLVIEGAFNVNSTSVEAWEALLSARSDIDYDIKTATGSGSPSGDTGFSRFQQSVDATGAGDDTDTWGGYRDINSTDLHDLAVAIVDQIKRRTAARGGPFLTLGEFVNRSLTNDEFGLSGAIQSAIDTTATLNDDYQTILAANPMSAAGVPTGFDATKCDWDHWRGATSYSPLHTSRNAGTAGMLMQHDVLAAIGSQIASRSDTFRIRTYGDVTDPVDGRVTARAWCEAIVQRLPAFVDDNQLPETGTASLNTENASFGRRFAIVSLRWLSPEEI